MNKLLTLSFGVALGAAGLYGAQTIIGKHNSSQPYAGQDERYISSLSPDDIRQLENGEGWGLAKPAELNGYPGPAHVLEFADKLNLGKEQRVRIEKAFSVMNAKARELGVALIEAEAALDDAFKSGTASEAVLRERLAATEVVRADLRETHLAAHLEITPLLTEEQKAQYASLRGYGAGHSDHSGH
jgi:Spy/CpxP family protein refolding chaperone